VSAATALRLKVMVADAWMPLLLEVPPTETVARLKVRALEEATIDAATAAEYEVKFGGAPVRDESQTLRALGVPDGAALIVLSRRRRAVR